MSGEVGTITQRIAELKEEVDRLAVDIKIKEDELNELKVILQRYLENAGLDSLKAHGLNFYLETKVSVKTPKTDEQKRELFQFLMDEGIFYEMASVHSASLNSLYQDYAERALEEGNLDFRLPGVDEPTPYTQIKIRKTK